MSSTGPAPATPHGRPAPATKDGRPAVVTPHANEVRLVGRLAAGPVRRVLPSGDPLVSFRLVVDRTPAARRAARSATARAPTIDTLDCAAWRKGVQRSLERVAPGDVLEVSGALRRRFWRSGSGAVSRSEVEVTKVRRLAAR